MGGSTDAHKLVSSLTLFRAAATELAQDDNNPDFTRLADLCGALLERASAQDYPPCEFTLERCEA